MTRQQMWTRRLLGVVVSALVLAPYAAKAEEPTPRKAAQAQFNQVYVKVIMPTATTGLDKDRPVVESWIAADLKKLGQANFAAVTAWVPLDLSPLEATNVWDGELGSQSYCPVGADIERAKGLIIKVNVSGWSPCGGFVTISLKDEPGSRVIAAVKELKTEQGMPYVAVFIGPPAVSSAAPPERKRNDDQREATGG